LAAPAVAIAGLIPGASFVYRCCHWLKQDELVGIYANVSLLEAVISAIAGFAAGYILLRLGSHLKSKRQSGS
jgi:hypothetical protein